MTSLSERLEDLKKNEAPATLKNSGLAKLEAALDNFKELVRNGQTQPRGYQLRSVDQGIQQNSIYNVSTATPGTS